MVSSESDRAHAEEYPGNFSPSICKRAWVIQRRFAVSVASAKLDLTKLIGAGQK